MNQFRKQILFLVCTILLLFFQNCSNDGLPSNASYLSSGGDPSSISESKDPHWQKVVLLMHMNGANGSLDFKDARGRHLDIWSVGSPITSTAQSKFGGSSLYLDGSSYLVLPNSPDWDLSAVDATIESWVYWMPNPGSAYAGTMYGAVVSQSPYTMDGNWLFTLASGSSGFGISAQFNGGGQDVFARPAGFPEGDWHHVAVSKRGNTTSLFLDGRLMASANANPFQVSTNLLYIGAMNTSSFGFNFAFKGYLAELRITKGIARYTADFAVPSAAFPEQ